MKKLIFSFFLCGATMFPAFSQTYQELRLQPRSKTACHWPKNTLNKL